MNSIISPSGQKNNEFALWDLATKYRAGDLVVYTSKVYVANDIVPANTPFTIGTTGATWALAVSDTVIRDKVTNAGNAGQIQWANVDGNLTSSERYFFGANGGGALNVSRDGNSGTGLATYSYSNQASIGVLFASRARGTKTAPLAAQVGDRVFSTGGQIYTGVGTATADSIPGWSPLSQTPYVAADITALPTSPSTTFGSKLSFAASNATTNSTRVMTFNDDGSLEVPGKVTAVGGANLGAIGGITITGGTTGQVISTDGTGNLTWATASGGSGTPAGANTQIQFNDAGAFGANSTLTFDKTTGLVSVKELAVTGNIQTSLLPGANITYDLGSPTQRWKDIYLSNNTIHMGDASLSANAGNITLSGNLVATQIFGAANTVTDSVQANITSVGTLTGLAISGDITASGGASPAPSISGFSSVSAEHFDGTLSSGTSNVTFTGVDGNVLVNVGESTYKFGDDGILSLTNGFTLGAPGGYAQIFTVNSLNLGSHNDVSISTLDGDYDWTFDINGGMTLPYGGTITEPGIPAGFNGRTIALTPAGTSNPNQQLLVYPTVAGDNNHLHLTSGNLMDTELFLGDDNLNVKLANTGNVVINTNDMNGLAAQWTFGADGSLSLSETANEVATLTGTRKIVSLPIAPVEAPVATPTLLFTPTTNVRTYKMIVTVNHDSGMGLVETEIFEVSAATGFTGTVFSVSNRLNTYGSGVAGANDTVVTIDGSLALSVETKYGTTNTVTFDVTEFKF